MWIVVLIALFSQTVAAAPNNVLLIIADDLGSDSLSGFNDDESASFAMTPTINSLQAQGISFTRYYAYSTCSPTRASILTGRYSFRTGVLAPEVNTLRSNEFTLPEALIASGVIETRMANIGKWHLGSQASSPNNIGGWPHFAGALGGGISDYYSWPKVVNGVTTSAHNVYATTDNVNDSITWIDEQGGLPWFLWLSFNAPHTPLHWPPNELHDFDGISDDGANSSRRHYEAMVQAMDTEIARLLSNVNLAETTVIFMGDNGTLGGVVQPPFPSTHSKGSVYEGGIRVPMIIAGAAVDSSLVGTSYDGLLHSCDLYATILELFETSAEAMVPEEVVLDSRSFLPVLSGQDHARSPAEIMVRNESGAVFGRGITEGNFKYILFDDGREEFYDVDADLPEATDLLLGALSTGEQTAFDALKERLAEYVNVPHAYGSGIDGSGDFNVELGWFANEGFTLWYRELVGSGSWTAVSDQEFDDDGGQVLILRDPTPPNGNAFYRVSSP
ncbi:sulfatase-like hydrolase/transferase [Verrucomicrobia bacterium]|nr:sulfatase-like hydrolase/transferase [Verrucomicrobiota bacterium]